MTKKLADKLKEIAEADDFPETLKTSDLKGKTVNLLSVRTVETENGLRFIGNIELDGQHREAWLSGSKLHQQVEAIQDALPQTVAITKGEGQYDPYLLNLA
jgi:hypothetical protein|tara:strand:- start:805 stop:1107 length:303 start_codon:yes stop_codon:yes gene_type:complete